MTMAEIRNVCCCKYLENSIILYHSSLQTGVCCHTEKIPQHDRRFSSGEALEKPSYSPQESLRLAASAWN